MMLAEYALASADHAEAIGRRRTARRETRMPGRVGNDGVRSLCRISDVSANGVRLYAAQSLGEDVAIMLTLPGQKPRAARVVWTDGYVAGCVFDQPLDDATVATLTGIYAALPSDPPIED